MVVAGLMFVGLFVYGLLRSLDSGDSFPVAVLLALFSAAVATLYGISRYDW